MALPDSNGGLFRTFSSPKMKTPTDLISSSTTSPTNNSSSNRSRLSFSVDSLLSRKQVVVVQNEVADEDVESDDENGVDSDESVDVEDTSSEIDENSHRRSSHLNNNNDEDIGRADGHHDGDEAFKASSPVLRHPPFLAGIVAMAAAAAAAANSTSPPTLVTSTPPTACPPHLQPWPSPGPGFHLGLPGLRHPMFHKPGGKFL